MLYVYGAEPPDTNTVAVPDAVQRLSVAVTELMTSGVAAGHWAFAVYTHASISSMQSIACLRVRYIVIVFLGKEIGVIRPLLRGRKIYFLKQEWYRITWMLYRADFIYNLLCMQA